MSRHPSRAPPTANSATPRVAKYAEALRGGHRVVPLIAEVWGGFAVDAMSFLRYSRVAGDLYLARS